MQGTRALRCFSGFSVFSFLFLFFILVFSSFSFAGLLWTFDVNGPVSYKPVQVDNMLVFASQDGNAYAISLDGNMLWKKYIGTYILQPLVFNNDLVFITTKGHYIELRKDGSLVRDLQLNATQNIGYVYGADADPGRIYFTAQNGVFTVDKQGFVSQFYQLQKNATTLTPPLVLSDGSVFFGADDYLLSLENGKRMWESKLGTSWKSKPVEIGNAICLGTLDNSFYCVDESNGALKTKTAIDGWVIGNPFVDGNVAYFGTTAGLAYAVDAVVGSIMWSKPLDGGVTSMPTKGMLGGRNAIFMGSDEGALYVFDAQNGKLLWKWFGKGKLGSPLFAFNKVFVPSSDATIYALSTTKACFITSPVDGSTIGHKQVKMDGVVASDASTDVYVRSEGGEWQQAESGNGEWTLLLDPTPLSNGANVIECKVSGDEASFSYVLNRDTSLPLGTFALFYPATVEPGKEFTIFVLDSENNAPIDDFTAVVGSKTMKSSGNFTIKFDSVGKNPIKIKKIGFEDTEISIETKTGGIDIIMLAGGGILLLVLLYFYFFIYKRR